TLARQHVGRGRVRLAELGRQRRRLEADVPLEGCGTVGRVEGLEVNELRPVRRRTVLGQLVQQGRGVGRGHRSARRAVRGSSEKGTSTSARGSGGSPSTRS